VQNHAIELSQPLAYYYKIGVTTPQVVQNYQSVNVKFESAQDAGKTTQFFPSNLFDFGPRVGLAYNVGGSTKTVVRAGYGIYFVREDVGSVDQLSFQAPFLPIAFGGGSPGCLGSYFSSNPLPGCPNPNPNALPTAGKLDPNFIPCQSVLTGFTNNDPTLAPTYGCPLGGIGSIPTEYLFTLAVPRRFVSPSTQQWNLTVQRDLGKQWILEVGYVGTHAIHLRETRTDIPERIASPTNPIVVTDSNNITYHITQNTLANGPIRSSNPQINGYNGFQIFDNSAYSHYHSVQTTVSRRWAQGYFQAAYTFSKSTDATSSGNTAFNTAYNNEAVLHNSYGLSDFDRPHRLAISYRYDLPFFSGATGWKKTALGGWTISGITVFQSGLPFSVIDSAAGSLYVGAGYTTTLTGSLASGGSISKGYTGGGIHNEINNGYLNPANFARAPYYYYPAGICTDPSGNTCVTEFGNLGRNTFRGPHQQNWDFSLQKKFQLTERFGLRFTTDFFNIWNHANFANPSVTDVEAGSAFGKIVSTTGTPRLIQFSLRLAF